MGQVASATPSQISLPTCESDAHDQNGSSKLLGCQFWMAWLNNLVSARTVIYELSQCYDHCSEHEFKGTKALY